MKLLIKVTFGSILRKPNKLDVMGRTTPERVKTGIIKENIDEPIVPITLNNPREKTHKCVRISPISEIYMRVSIQINASQQNGLLAPSKFVHKPNFFPPKTPNPNELKGQDYNAFIDPDRGGFVRSHILEGFATEIAVMFLTYNIAVLVRLEQQNSKV